MLQDDFRLQTTWGYRLPQSMIALDNG
jgi:hypothetical protein